MVTANWVGETAFEAEPNGQKSYLMQHPKWAEKTVLSTIQKEFLETRRSSAPG